jgi:hypothetical protein
MLMDGGRNIVFKPENKRAFGPYRFRVARLGCWSASIYRATIPSGPIPAPDCSGVPPNQGLPPATLGLPNGLLIALLVALTRIVIAPGGSIHA